MNIFTFFLLFGFVRTIVTDISLLFALIYKKCLLALTKSLENLNLYSASHLKICFVQFYKQLN